MNIDTLNTLQKRYEGRIIYVNFDDDGTPDIWKPEVSEDNQLRDLLKILLIKNLIQLEDGQQTMFGMQIKNNVIYFNYSITRKTEENKLMWTIYGVEGNDTLWIQNKKSFEYILGLS